MPPAERVLVVVPCLNEVRYIRSVIASALEGLSGLSGTLVIVDGGSTDGTLSVVEELLPAHPNLKLLRNPQRIQSAAVNLAVAAFGGDHDVMVRLDAHAGYPKDFIRRCVETAAQAGSDVVVVPMITTGTAFFQRSVAFAQNSLLGNGGSPHRSKPVSRWVDHGHHAFITLAAFREVGGYDPSFSHNEDAELDVRLGKVGRRIWMAADLAIVYYPRSTPLALFRQYMAYGRGRARTLLKHRIRPKLRQSLPAFVLPALLLAPLHWPLTAVPALCWALVCLAAGIAAGVAEKDGAAWLSGVPIMIMHLGWSIGFWRAMLASLFSARQPASTTKFVD